MPELDIPPAKLPPGPHRGRKWHSRKPPAAGDVWRWDTARTKMVLTSPEGGAPHTHEHWETTGRTENDHHTELHTHAAESHTVASHSDTTATGAQLNAVTLGGEVDLEHTHRLTTYITIAVDYDGINFQGA